jgi:hypothetical protein
MNAATMVAVAVFMAGVIYQSGRLTVRIELLEAWREEARADLREIRQSIAEIKVALLKRLE